MNQMRTIDKAMDYILQADPDSDLTKTALRRFVTTGKLKSVKVGNKYLISLDEIDAFLSGAQATQDSQPFQKQRVTPVWGG